MTHPDRLKRARIALILDEPFFGSLLMRLKPIEGGCKTFCTNGQYLRYNTAYMDTRSDIQIKTICCEEVLHCGFLHFLRRGDRDSALWNEACDYAIYSVLNRYNKECLAKGRAAPFDIGDSLFDPRFDGMAAEEIYIQLQTERAHSDPPPSGGSQPPSPTPQSTPQSGGSSPRGASRGAHAPSRVPAHAPCAGPVSPGEFVDGACDQSGLDEGEANWKVAMQQAAEAAKSQGKLPADIARMVKELVDPAVPWRETLRNFITAFAKDDYSWARPNRRFSQHSVILPSLHSPKLGEIAVAIDTSGSIGEKELAIFLSEIRSILFDCHPEKLILLQCDAEVQDYQELTDNDSIFSVDAAQFEMKGGWGTSFVPVFERLEENGTPPAALIYLTDLAGDFPSSPPSYPVLWATINDDEAPFGTTLNIK